MSDASRPDASTPTAPAHPLTLRVGVAGHRETDAAALAPSLTEAFALIARAAQAVALEPVKPGSTETVAQAHAAIWPGSTPSLGLTLLVGQAPGADSLATAQWRAGRHGAVHALFPYADPDAPERFAWTDTPNADDKALRVELPGAGDRDGPFESWTVLDGRAAPAAVHNAHLDQSRWLTRFSDIVVVAWNGQAAVGPGGTADTVALALAKNLPVLWIETAPLRTDRRAMTLRLLRPGTMRADSQFSELLEALATAGHREMIAQAATMEAVRDILMKMLNPPASPAAHAHGESGRHDADEETAARHAYARPHRPAAPRWKGWSKLRGYVGESFRHRRARIAERLAPVLAGGWLGFYRLMTPEAKPGHNDVPGETPKTPAPAATHGLIEAAFLQSDAQSSASGNLHRAVQIVLLATAVLAVLAGTSPALNADIKWWAVLIEFLLLGAAALMLSAFASNHRHWSDTRRLAERLRALAATWPLGFDVSDRAADQPRTWTEWQVRAILRAAGPPIGVMSQERVGQALQGAFHHPDGLVAGQAGYNETRHGRMHGLHHRVERVERLAFTLLLSCLGLFLAAYLVVPVAKSIGNVLLILSAVVPTIGAACLALDAKLGIEESARKARQLKDDFDELRKRFDDPKNDMQHRVDLLRQAALLLMSDVDGWRDAAVRRRIWAG